MKSTLLKKVMVMSLAVMMTVGIMAGCGNSSGTSSSETGTTGSTAAASSTTENTGKADTSDTSDTSTTSTADVSTSKKGDYVYKVGFVNIDDADNCCYPAMQKFEIGRAHV